MQLMPHVPPSGGNASTPLDAGDRPVQTLQEGSAQNPQAFRLASQGFGGDADRLDLSSRAHPSFPLCNHVPSRQQGITGVLRNTRALHQDRIRPGAAIGDPRRSRQDVRLCGPQEAHQLHSVRAFPNGRAAYYSAAHSPQRLDHRGGFERLLHALPHRPFRPQKHAVHVEGEEVH